MTLLEAGPVAPVPGHGEQDSARMPRTVWSSGGCASWYLDALNNTTLWPGSTWGYRLRTRRFDPACHVTHGVRAPAGANAA